MKCPKCSYTSFDYLDNCRKCGADLRDVRSLIQIISVPPEELAPSYPPKAPEAPYPADPVPADADSLFGNDIVPGNLGDPQGTDRDLLSGLDFDQSFEQLVDAAHSPESAGKDSAQQDGLLDLDFGDVFGDADAKDKA